MSRVEDPITLYKGGIGRRVPVIDSHAWINAGWSLNQLEQAENTELALFGTNDEAISTESMPTSTTDETINIELTPSDTKTETSKRKSSASNATANTNTL